jgi:hypothetical protein
MSLKRDPSAITSALQARLAARGIKLAPKTDKNSKTAEKAEKDDAETPKLTQNSVQFTDEFGEDLNLGWHKEFSKLHDTWYYWDQLTDRVSWLPPTHEYHEAQLTRKDTEMNRPKPTGINLKRSQMDGRRLDKTQDSMRNSGQNSGQKSQKPKKSLPNPPPKPQGRLFHPNNTFVKPQETPPKKSKFSLHGSNPNEFERYRPEEHKKSRARPFAGKLRKGELQRGDLIDPMDVSSYTDAPATGAWSTGQQKAAEADGF